MASSSSSTPQEKKHDVFLSFRGEDTRYAFTSHLHAALSRLEIKTYIDYNLNKGDEISSMLLGAIEESKLAVIVFSKNYATSSWCLEELVKIIDCKRTNGQIVVPIFYDIDPSHVRNQSGSYADAFAKHEQRFKGNMQKVQGWRASLTEAANLAGWDCLVHRIESQLVEQIAMDVFQKLRCLNLGDLEGQIATYKHIAKLQTKKMVNDGFNLRDWKQLLATQNQITQLNMEKYKRSKGGASWDIESSDEDR